MNDYAKGFKDGFLAGVEEGKKLNDKTYMDGLTEGMKKTLPPPYVPITLPGYTLDKRDTCPKCGIKISGVMNYNCSSINCPTFYTATSSVGKPMTGAVGSTAVGANGPAGYDHNDLQGYDRVWMNGQWVEAGK